MKISYFSILVKTGKKNFKIIKNEDLFLSVDYILELKNAPLENKANKEIIEELSKFFKTERGKIKIVKGEKSSKKYIKIEGLLDCKK